MVDAASVVQYLLNGVAFGAVLVLAAVGLTLVYGILGLPNFAHGELLALGAYTAFAVTVLLTAVEAQLVGLGVAGLLAVGGVAGLVVQRRGAPVLERPEGLAVLGAAGLLGAVALLGLQDRYLLGVLLAAVVTAVVAVGVEGAVWRPLRHRRATALTLIIVSIGVAFILRSSLALQFGSDFLNYERPLMLPHFVGPLTITQDQVTTIATAGVLVAGLHLFLARTRTGQALRALADNRDLARLSGIDVDRMTAVVWVLAGGLAAVAGALLPLNNFQVTPNVGFLLLLVVFAAVILGGLGSAHGAMVGGMVVGIAVELSAGLWRAEYKFAVGFVVLVAALLLRPQGLFGGKVA